MEELQQLAEIINSLPQFALWIFILFFAYKVIFVGSVFGLIRFITGKISDYYMRESRIIVKNFKRSSFFQEAALNLLDDFLTDQVKSSELKYIHKTDIVELIKVWNKHKETNNG